MKSQPIRKKRLIVCNGVAQLMFVDASLAAASEANGQCEFEDHIMVYLIRHSDEKQNLLLQLTERIRCWHSIEFVSTGDSSSSQLDNQLSRLGRIDEVWVCMPGNRVEQAAMKAFPDARLVFYEDGLNAYTELHRFRQLIRHPIRALRWSLVKSAHTLTRMGLGSLFSCWPYRKFDESWLLLRRDLDPASRYQAHETRDVTSATLLDSVRKIRAISKANIPDVSDPRRTIVMLGCIFYLTRTMSWDDELKVYRTIIDEILSKGYRVLWKEHPRSTRPFGPEIQRQIDSGFECVESNHLFPVELLFVDAPIAGCVSPHSTSLFTLRMLFGTKTFNTVRQFEQNYFGAVKEAIDLVLLHTNALDALEPASPELLAKDQYKEDRMAL